MTSCFQWNEWAKIKNDAYLSSSLPPVVRENVVWSSSPGGGTGTKSAVSDCILSMAVGMRVLHSASSQSQQSLVAVPTGRQAGKSDDCAAGETVTVVILADADLLQLPLEAVASLRADVIDSVSRDISLQLLYHRLTTTPSGECQPNML